MRSPVSSSTPFANIFKPFYQLEEARVRRNGGVGISLAITSQAIEAHGGSATAYNNNPVDGLTIRIVLPTT